MDPKDVITIDISGLQTYDYDDILRDWEQDRLWEDIHREAKSNPSLQQAIERVKILYYLSKEDGQ